MKTRSTFTDNPSLLARYDYKGAFGLFTVCISMSIDTAQVSHIACAGRIEIDHPDFPNSSIEAFYRQSEEFPNAQGGRPMVRAFDKEMRVAVAAHPWASLKSHHELTFTCAVMLLMGMSNHQWAHTLNVYG